MRAGQNAYKRSVYINGVYCESMAAGAREATRAAGVDIQLWQIQRAVNGVLKIEGIEVSERQPAREMEAHEFTCEFQGDKTSAPLLRYPFGEGCLDRGITRIWA